MLLWAASCESVWKADVCGFGATLDSCWVETLVSRELSFVIAVTRHDRPGLWSDQTHFLLPRYRLGL